MCGIAGFIGRRIANCEEVLEEMKSSIDHRGPDGHSSYIAVDGRVALGHRRLAILDPEHGQQPMVAEERDAVLVFNGCIYNYLELRRELVSLGHKMHTYSDTEVVLAAYIQWGEKCLDRFNGMFAFAVWDGQKRRLFCARDRIGIKPFYYTEVDGVFLFGSEIKALLASGLVERKASSSGLQDYLSLQFCLQDKTLFDNIKKLEPGYFMIVELGEDGGQLKTHYKQYWDINFSIDDKSTEEQFIDSLSALIEDAISIQLRSDVPIGAHLSGGLDSSTVVCHATTLLGGASFSTFTGTFSEGPEFDESRYAKLVASHTGANYHEVGIPGSEFADILPKLIWHMDEPVAGPGLIPQYYVSKLASENVKVVLGGQGGDELFIGYARYLVAYLEKCLNGAIYETSDETKYAVSLESILPNLPVLKQYRPMLQRFWKTGLFDNDDKRYFSLIDRSEGMSSLLNPSIFDNSYSPFESFQKIFNNEGLHSLVNRISYFDIKASLPALLQVEDRTSMSVSIESRVPLLDHRIVELMGRVPPNIKFAGGRLKHLFKEAVKHKVPEKVFERKDKMGFPVPLNHWYQGVAKDFVMDTLLSKKAKERGFFNVSEIEFHLQKNHEFSRVIWGLLCLELWFQKHIDLA